MPNVYLSNDLYKRILVEGFEPSTFTDQAVKMHLDRSKAQTRLTTPPLGSSSKQARR